MSQIEKLEHQHIHVMRLIQRDADSDGWASVSEVLFKTLSEEVPSELVTFEKLEHGGRAALTDIGGQVLYAKDEWL